MEAAKRGGNPGGRKRDDGLVPGSPAAIAADRKKDNERKKLDYKKKQAALAGPPAALPSRAPALPDQNLALGQNPGAGLPVESDAPVPWLDGDLEPLVQETIALIEAHDIESAEDVLEEARITGPAAKEILADAPWPEAPKKSIQKYGGSSLAKGLNALGFSAKYKDAVLIVPALIFLSLDRIAFRRSLKQLVKSLNEPLTEKAGDKKP